MDSLANTPYRRRWCLAIGALLLMLNGVSGVYQLDWQQPQEMALRLFGLGLFLPLVICYTGLALCWVCQKVAKELAPLYSAVGFDEHQRHTFNQLVFHLGAPFWSRVMLMALFFSLLTIVLDGMVFKFGSLTSVQQQQFALILLEVTLMWLVVATACLLTLHHIRYLHRLSRMEMRFHLFYTDTLLPFSRIGVAYALLWSGSLALSPIYYLYAQFSLANTVIAFGLIITVSCCSVLMPMLPARHLIRGHKTREIERLNRAIKGEPQALADSHLKQDSDTLKLIDLLNYRQLVSDVSEWPVNAPIIQRLVLYLVIPVLSWSCASVFEKYFKLLL